MTCFVDNYDILLIVVSHLLAYVLRSPIDVVIKFKKSRRKV